jgi:hypothetical protein
MSLRCLKGWNVRRSACAAVEPAEAGSGPAPRRWRARKAWTGRREDRADEWRPEAGKPCRRAGHRMSRAPPAACTDRARTRPAGPTAARPRRARPRRAATARSGARTAACRNRGEHRSPSAHISASAKVSEAARWSRQAAAVDLAANRSQIRALGPMAEWLRRGLQILARRFDSGSGLHLPGQHSSGLPAAQLAVRVLRIAVRRSAAGLGKPRRRKV